MRGIVWLATLLSAAKCDLLNEYSGRPRIVVANGDMHFVPAAGRNIVLHVGVNGGSIIIGNTSVDAFPTKAQYGALESRMSQLEQSLLEAQADAQRGSDALGVHTERANALSDQVAALQHNADSLAAELLNVRTVLAERQSSGDIRIRRVVRNTMRRQLGNRQRLHCVEEKPCHNGATCVASYLSYLCLCRAGFEGSHCEYRQRQCAAIAGTPWDCAHGACVDLANNTRHYCHCDEGYVGDTCRQRSDECTPATSHLLCGQHGVCVPTVSGRGRLADAISDVFGDVVGLIEGEFDNRTAAYSTGGTGNGTAPSLRYRCVCDLGYGGSPDAGNPTCIDVDECGTGAHNCGPAECVNTDGAFVCGNCPVGLAKSDQSVGACVDVDECATDMHDCSPVAACLNTYGGYACAPCPSGWTGDGHTCTTVDPCSKNPCHVNATCVEMPGSMDQAGFRCQCPRVAN